MNSIEYLPAHVAVGRIVGVGAVGGRAAQRIELPNLFEPILENESCSHAPISLRRMSGPDGPTHYVIVWQGCHLDGNLFGNLNLAPAPCYFHCV